MFTHQSNTLRRRARHRQGLTLVEMMISVALTLMVVFALVRVFEALGNHVTDGQATIEMSGNLRSAANILRADLAGLTVTTLPPRAPDQGEGYFEIVDCPATDSQQMVQLASGQPKLVNLADPTLNALDDPTNPDGFLDNVAGFDTSVGDVDDILAFTPRRTNQPFTGTISDGRIMIKNTPLIPMIQAPTLILDSPEAEIVWWLEIDRNLATSDVAQLRAMSAAGQIENYVSAIGSPGIENGGVRTLTAQRYPNFTDATLGTPVRSLHRRVLLVRPDLDLSRIVLKGLDEVAEFISNNDISVRITRDGTSSRFHVEPNSLADLSKRKYRAFRANARWPESHAARQSPETTRISNLRNGQMLRDSSLLLRHGSMKDMVLDFKSYESGVGDGTNEVIMLRKGHDVVLSDVLAFDVQVWDPQAMVRISADGSTSVSPSDPGYIPAKTLPGRSGTYVDLGFAVPPKRPTALPTELHGLFGGTPHPKSFLPIEFSNTKSGAATYCTWSTDYEYDGYDQDKDGLIDPGSDGIDNNNLFGIDDSLEAETSPPYPYPLRGVKVTLRIMDYSTRQVRQTSVTTDFVAE